MRLEAIGIAIGKCVGLRMGTRPPSPSDCHSVELRVKPISPGASLCRVPGWNPSRVVVRGAMAWPILELGACGLVVGRDPRTR